MKLGQRAGSATGRPFLFNLEKHHDKNQMSVM